MVDLTNAVEVLTTQKVGTTVIADEDEHAFYVLTRTLRADTAQRLAQINAAVGQTKRFEILPGQLRLLTDYD